MYALIPSTTAYPPTSRPRAETLSSPIHTPIDTLRGPAMLIHMADDIKTIGDLAGLIKRTMASKEDMQAVHQDIRAIREDTAEINGRLDRIGKHMLADYGRRIENLEQELKRLKDALAA